jgi:hypothetical protein
MVFWEKTSRWARIKQMFSTENDNDIKYKGESKAGEERMTKEV